MRRHESPFESETGQYYTDGSIPLDMPDVGLPPAQHYVGAQPATMYDPEQEDARLALEKERKWLEYVGLGDPYDLI